MDDYKTPPLEEKLEQEETSFDEAPASVTVKIKSPAGFEYMFTMRDAKASVLMFKMKAMEANWTKSGFTPIAQNAFGKKETKPVEYVPNRMCPKCENQLIYGTTKTGKKLIKCSTNKWINGAAVGCPFIEWLDDANRVNA